MGNILTLLDARQHWASFPSSRWGNTAPVTQLQMCKKSRDPILLRVVAPQQLNAEERRKLIEAFQALACLGHSFKMDIEEVAALWGGTGFNFEEFLSEIAR